MCCLGYFFWLWLVGLLCLWVFIDLIVESYGNGVEFEIWVVRFFGGLSFWMWFGLISFMSLMWFWRCVLNGVVCDVFFCKGFFFVVVKWVLIEIIYFGIGWSCFVCWWCLFFWGEYFEYCVRWYYWGFCLFWWFCGRDDLLFGGREVGLMFI